MQKNFSGFRSGKATEIWALKFNMGFGDGIENNAPKGLLHLIFGFNL